MCGAVLFLSFVLLARMSVGAATDESRGFYQNVSMVVNRSRNKLDMVTITINDKNYLMSNLVRKLIYCDASINHQQVPVLYKNTFYGLVTEHLQIESNVTDIRPHAFNNSVLNRLTLRNNQLEEARGHFFFNISVNGVDMSFNNIKYIERGAFREIARPDQQDPFKDNFCEDTDKYPPPDWISNSYYTRGLNYDSRIDLTGNKLETIAAGVFKNLTVRFLGLLNNQIRILEPNSFTECGFLETIMLQRNKLRSIGKDVFKCYHLINLFFHNNDIESIEAGSFEKLPEIRYIKLSLNKLRKIRKGVFNISLKELALDGNQISSIEQGAFEGLKVDRLDLGNNTLGHVSKGVFYNFSVNTLTLRGNSITTIEPQAFVDLPQLKILCLYNNKLTNIDHYMFHNVPSLESIDLRENAIVFTSPAAFDGLPVIVGNSTT